MTLRIVAFPPVAIIAPDPWTEAPLAREESLWSRVSINGTAGPARRLLNFEVPALAGNRAGAGYIHQLLRELDYGVHFVRVASQPVNWWMDRKRVRAIGFDGPVLWADGTPVTWDNGGTPVLWFSGAVRVVTTGTSADGYPTITVPGLPPGQIVARPSDVIRVYPADDRVVGQTAEVVTVATAGADGVAVIKLASALPAGIVSLADADTRVYEVTDWQRAAQPISGAWGLRLSLREKLAGEIPEDAVEWNPW